MKRIFKNAMEGFLLPSSDEFKTSFEAAAPAAS